MTKATDWITIFLKSPSKNGCRNMCHTLIFVINKTKTKKKVIFSTLPSTQTTKVIDLIFFNELAFKNWAMNMHSTLYLLSKAFYIDSEPVRPAFTWPKSGNLIENSAANIWELITRLEQTLLLIQIYWFKCAMFTGIPCITS